MNASDITAVILTRNEERNLPRALGSLPAGMQLLVVDAQSTDRTQSLARDGGAAVVVRRWAGFPDARMYALAHVHTPWTLMIDADEALDQTLRDALLAAAGDVDAYAVRRDTYFCGRPLRMWKGERIIRVFRTDRAQLRCAPVAGGEAELHEHWVVDGPKAELAGILLHFSYPDAATYRERYERYTSIEASGVTASRAGVLWARLSGLAHFAWYLVARGALLDGRNGVYVAYHSAMYPARVLAKAYASGG